MNRYRVRNIDFDPAGREPEGSIRWIERRVVMMQGCYDAIDRRWQDFWSVMKSLVSTRAWETYPVGTPWGDCETMLREVLGEEPENVLRSIAKIPEAAELGQYVNGLTERQREARALREQGLKQREIAEKLGVSRETVAVDLATTVTKEKRAKSNADRTAARQVYLPQDPAAAAEKLMAKFGSDYARDLAAALARRFPEYVFVLREAKQ